MFSTLVDPIIILKPVAILVTVLMAVTMFARFVTYNSDAILEFSSLINFLSITGTDRALVGSTLPFNH